MSKGLPALPLDLKEAVKMIFPQLAIISRPPVPVQLISRKIARFSLGLEKGRPNNFVANATNLCARIMPHLCV